MVKQVGIMSMQRIINYGSSLQAYGLKRLIEGLDPECEVKFVDYRPGPRLSEESEPGAPWAAFGRKLSNFRERAAVKAPVTDRIRFYNQMRRHTFSHRRKYASRNYPMLGIPSSPDYNLELDLQVIGSDEVFNCLQTSPDVGYSRDLFGHESAAKRLVSYAASFGNTTLEKILEAQIATDLASDLSQFDSISVRDANSAAIIEALTGRIPAVNVDPVLAYDFMAREPSVPAGRMYDEKYMILYAYPGRVSQREGEAVRRFADSRGLDVLAFGGPHVCADRFIDCGPFELLAYFRDADAVVTDTFHGTIFSLINHRPFAAIVRSSAGHSYGNEEKLRHLLQTFDLKARSALRITDLDAVIDVPVDKSRTEETLKIEREKASRYLINVLDGNIDEG